MNDINRLWVHVSSFGEGNLFGVYPKLLAEMLATAEEKSNGPPDFEYLLPSDPEWRTKIYYQLVEKQRALVGMVQPSAFLDKARTPGQWDTTLPQPPSKKPRRCKLSSSNTCFSRESVSSSVPPVTWTVSDIAKAGHLLNTPPDCVEFGDEQEMRRVYSLIYDVFRYKNILSQALRDIGFFAIFPEQTNMHIVWLLLYDLYHRRFAERDQPDAESSDKLFPRCEGLTRTEAALWATRVRLAAALSRLRIANSALRLSDMLPTHLRDERVARASQLAPVTCWVNKNQANNKTPEQLFYEIEEVLDLEGMSDDSTSIGPNEFRWDPHCPMFLSFHHTQRTLLAQSKFVRKNILIMQNKSFCFGPAVFCKMLFKHNLTGKVIQTHITSPRSTAYLATLLTDNDQIFALLVFGAGPMKEEYEEYFKDLNIKNVTIYSESLIEMESKDEVLEQVVAVFVTPPNSYSAVIDPIDLVCSRGGDLSMLEILTDTSDSLEGQKRVARILEEQRMALRFSMSRPQIQFVVYGTHSTLSAENDDMVNQVLTEINRAATYRHAELQGKLHHPHPTTARTEQSSATALPISVMSEVEINNNETEITKKEPLKGSAGATKERKGSIQEKKEVVQECQETKPKESDTLITLDSEDEDPYKNIKVPPTDLFEQQNLPDLCFNSDACLSLNNEGCFLALIQRKEVVRLDAKYMIKMAETRGLFGYANADSTPKPKISKTAKQRKTKEVTNTVTPVKRKRGTFEVERIAAQTHASMMRSCTHALRTDNLSDASSAVRCCPRCAMADNSVKQSPAKMWWGETIRYLTRLRRTLMKQKMVSMKPALMRIVQHEKILQDIRNIDEILARLENTKSANGPNIPVFPKLRLSRNHFKHEKNPFPIYINFIELVD